MAFKSELIFVRILCPFICGIILSYLFQQKIEAVVSLLITAGLLFCLVLINIRYQQFKAYQYKGEIGISIIIFWFSAGTSISLIHAQQFQRSYFDRQSADCLKVWVSSEPQLNNGILRMEVDVVTTYLNKHPQNATGKLLIALKVNDGSPIILNYGDQLLIPNHYLPVEPPYNPAEFDFKAWLASKNLYHQLYINQNELIKLSGKNGNPIIRYAIDIRKKQVAIYRKLIHNDEAYAVASTLVLGYRADLSKETLSAYSKTGTIHALSVSGMHVGIIYIFLNWALFFLNRNNLLKLTKVLIIGSLIWYYSLLTGFSPSVLRSAVMLSVYILAKAFNKNSNNYNIVAFTACCLLFYNPFLIWDVGFQLSFLAVLGLIYLQPKIYGWLNIKYSWLDKIWGTIALSLAAQIATFPLSIYYFHQFPLYFIFSNLFILLPLTAMMYLGIAILMLKLYFLAPIFEWIINFTNAGLKWIADLPFSGITSIWIDQWQLFLLCCSLISFVFAVANYHKKYLLLSIALLTIFQLRSTYQQIGMLSQRKILCFSLRKNYAAAFINGNQAVLLTDLTIADRTFEFFVKPALEQLQLKKISLVHWESDTTINAFFKKDHQIRFLGYSILLIDKHLEDKKILQLPKFDAVWIHQNSKKNVIDLRSEVLFSTLLIDASNKDYKAREYQQGAHKIEVRSHILKKNKAYLIELNK